MHDKPINSETNIIKNIFAKSLTESVNNSEKNNTKEINEGLGQALARLFGRGAIGAAKVARTAGAAVDAGAASAAARAKAAGEAVTAGIKGTGEAVGTGAKKAAEAVGTGVKGAAKTVSSAVPGFSKPTVIDNIAKGGVMLAAAGTAAHILSNPTEPASTEPASTEPTSTEIKSTEPASPQTKSEMPSSQLDRELGGMSPTERLSAMQKRWDNEKAKNLGKRVDDLSKKVDEFGAGLTKPWNVDVSTPTPSTPKTPSAKSGAPKMSEKQIADSILKTITDIANKQTPKEVVNKMNDPSRGGQSGRFGGDNTTVAYSGPFSERGSEASKPTLVSSGKKPNYYNALFEKLERLEEATQKERAGKYVQSRGFNIGGSKGGVVVANIKPSKLKKHLDTIEAYPGGEPTETGGEEEIGTNTRLDPDWFTHKAVVSLMTNAQTTGVELSHGEAMRMATEMLEQHRQNPSLHREFLPEPGEKRPQFPDPMENFARFAKKNK